MFVLAPSWSQQQQAASAKSHWLAEPCPSKCSTHPSPPLLTVNSSKQNQYKQPWCEITCLGFVSKSPKGNTKDTDQARSGSFLKPDGGNMNVQYIILFLHFFKLLQFKRKKLLWATKQPYKTGNRLLRSVFHTESTRLTSSLSSGDSKLAHKCPRHPSSLAKHPHSRTSPSATANLQ